MKKLVLVLMLSLGAASAWAVGPTEVQLLSSTMPGAPGGLTGELDTTAADQLVFRVPNHPVMAMPYAQITQYGARQDVTHHLGLIAFLLSGLVEPRQHRHFLTVSFTDGKGVEQVSTFEIGKELPRLLLPVLETRAPNACERREEFGSCTVASGDRRRSLHS